MNIDRLYEWDDSGDYEDEDWDEYEDDEDELVWRIIFWYVHKKLQAYRNEFRFGYTDDYIDRIK
jgi:hypothetical protein